MNVALVSSSSLLRCWKLCGGHYFEAASNVWQHIPLFDFLECVQAVVIGGGYIGLEMTAALRSNNLDVTCVLPQEHFLAKMLTDELGEAYESYYKEKGVNIRAKARAVSFEPKSPGSKQVMPVAHHPRVLILKAVVLDPILEECCMFTRRLLIWSADQQTAGMHRTWQGVYPIAAAWLAGHWRCLHCVFNKAYLH